MDKDADAYRTISEVAQALDIPPHVLRFWETRFPQIRPLKRGGGRRYYRRGDTDLLRMIRRLLYDEGYTIRGVQRLLKSKGATTIAPLSGEEPPAGLAEAAGSVNDAAEFAATVAGPRTSQATIMQLSAEIAACRTMLDAALRASGSPSEAAATP